MYIYVYLCIYIYIYIYTHIYIYISYIYIYTYIYNYMHVCSIYIFSYMHVCSVVVYIMNGMYRFHLLGQLICNIAIAANSTRRAIVYPGLRVRVYRSTHTDWWTSCKKPPTHYKPTPSAAEPSAARGVGAVSMHLRRCMCVRMYEYVYHIRMRAHAYTRTHKYTQTHRQTDRQIGR